jgi:hypothetical protein
MRRPLTSTVSSPVAMAVSTAFRSDVVKLMGGVTWCARCAPGRGLDGFLRDALTVAGAVSHFQEN